MRVRCFTIFCISVQALTHRPELWVEVKDEQVRLILLEYCTERRNSSGSTAVHIEQSITVVKAAKHLQEL